MGLGGRETRWIDGREKFASREAELLLRFSAAAAAEGANAAEEDRQRRASRVAVLEASQGKGERGWVIHSRTRAS